MEANYQTIDIEFPYEDGKTIAQAQEGVDVLERSYEEDGVKLKIRGKHYRVDAVFEKYQRHAL